MTTKSRTIGVGRRVYEVRDPDYDSDWKTVNADDPRDAVETYCEAVWGHRDYFNSCDLDVRLVGGEAERFTVTVESRPEFVVSRAKGAPRG